jgi:intron-binding protein aquarius
VEFLGDAGKNQGLGLAIPDPISRMSFLSLRTFLQHVMECQEYKTGNAGFEHTFQFSDVPDILGKGETTPTAYFYQNLGEAEYAVALFQFMILISYDPGKVTILTAYNGQKELILDILKQQLRECSLFRTS